MISLDVKLTYPPFSLPLPPPVIKDLQCCSTGTAKQERVQILSWLSSEKNIWLLMYTDGLLKEKSPEHHTVYAQNTDPAAKGNACRVWGNEAARRAPKGSSAPSEFLVDVPRVIHQLAAGEILAVF